jgi:glycosyltransferase involved in cell wall biosynthesis
LNDVTTRLPIRILYVCPYYKPAYVYGGPVRCFSNSCEGLVELGVQVTVFTTNANGSSTLDVPLQQPMDINGVTVWYFPLTFNGLSFFYSRPLAEAVRCQVSNYDLVVNTALYGHSLIPTAKACTNACVPYVIPPHGQLFPWAMEEKRLKKKIYLELFGRYWVNRAAAIHCTDPSEAEAVAKLMVRPPVFVVPNVIRASSFSTYHEQGYFRRQLGVADNAELMIFVGRITRIKRPDIAVDALAAAQSLKREIHLVIVGPDEDGLMHQLQTQARNLGCQDRLHFTGLLGMEGVVSALADADLLLMPSEITENFGVSAVEAMAAGVPILVSVGVPVGRWAEQVGAGRVVPCTPNAFAKAAVEILSDHSTLKEMGKRGRELARERFDISVVARQMLAQYESIIETGKPLP